MVLGVLDNKVKEEAANAEVRAVLVECVVTEVNV